MLRRYHTGLHLQPLPHRILRSLYESIMEWLFSKKIHNKKAKVPPDPSETMRPGALHVGRESHHIFTRLERLREKPSHSNDLRTLIRKLSGSEARVWLPRFNHPTTRLYGCTHTHTHIHMHAHPRTRSTNTHTHTHTHTHTDTLYAMKRSIEHSNVNFHNVGSSYTYR